MSAFASLIITSGVILAVIFAVLFAIGRKFRADNPGFAQSMTRVGVIGVVACVAIVVAVAVWGR